MVKIKHSSCVPGMHMRMRTTQQRIYIRTPLDASSVVSACYLRQRCVAVGHRFVVARSDDTRARAPNNVDACAPATLIRISTSLFMCLYITKER